VRHERTVEKEKIKGLRVEGMVRSWGKEEPKGDEKGQKDG
jgi:hypothetical protein